jgi:hypothetical protein
VSTTTKPGYAQPALIGGVVLGVLSALPIVSVGNACCCLWVVAGGVIAAYLFQQNQHAPITPADGALVGLFAGLIGAVVARAISIPIDLMLGPVERQLVQRIMETSNNPQLREMFDRMSDRQRSIGPMYVLFQMLAFVLWLCVNAIFSTLGGLLGAMMFRKDTPPGVIDVPS